MILSSQNLNYCPPFICLVFSLYSLISVSNILAYRGNSIVCLKNVSLIFIKRNIRFIVKEKNVACMTLVKILLVDETLLLHLKVLNLQSNALVYL